MPGRCEISGPPAAKRRPARPTAGGAEAAGPWTLSAPSIGLAADLMTLGGPDGPAGLDGLSLPVPPLARAAT